MGQHRTESITYRFDGYWILGILKITEISIVRCSSYVHNSYQLYQNNIELHNLQPKVSKTAYINVLNCRLLHILLRPVRRLSGAPQQLLPQPLALQLSYYKLSKFTVIIYKHYQRVSSLVYTQARQLTFTIENKYRINIFSSLIF